MIFRNEGATDQSEATKASRQLLENHRCWVEIKDMFESSKETPGLRQLIIHMLIHGCTWLCIVVYGYVCLYPTNIVRTQICNMYNVIGMIKCTFNTHIYIYIHIHQNIAIMVWQTQAWPGGLSCPINSWDFNRRRMDGLCHRFTECMFFCLYIIPKQLEA